ncbi:chemotaxis protein CheA [Fundidesulfovibrio agrisoli]|uniref:chemotaxis protein CheA n=1 Tax=Fundidesulfovibrio agrisoli TaxID=2922717 RepID=UPI001FAE6C08|nr:chemotaxis protein CheA [Fundidesulfovibrio agrisoli]
MTAQPSPNDLFREEARELLQELDAALLDLDPASAEAVNRVFRALHSLKGACDMFGLSASVAILHAIESQWDRVRLGLVQASRPLLDLTFAVKDRLEPVAESGADMGPGPELLEAMAAFEAGLPQATPATAAQHQAGASQPEPAQGTRAYRILLAPSDPGHLRHSEPASLLEELEALGPLEVRADVSAVPPLEDLDPADCHLRWEAALSTDQGPDAVKDVFLFLNNASDASVEELQDRRREASDVSPPDGADSGARDTVGLEGPAPEAPPQPAVPPPAAAPSPAPPAPPAPPAAKPREPAQSLRVEAAKLDNLVNLVGELVIAQARLTQLAAGQADSELTGVAEEIERLVGELRDNTLGIRMLPIGTTFSRFRRLVRDLSAELGKEIDLEAEGGETELDKTVIEQLGDPLVHLLRNSIDHGIEPAGERLAAGKPARGRIRLCARQAGGTVFIRIEDDGRGLSVERIRQKAEERGLVAPEARLSDQECFQLIFAPGFSTAQQVTSVSGRGVGMDVVKRAIESLRGKLEIESPPGSGTTITIQLPLTLAIIDGLQVRAGGEFYILPLAVVEECVELAADPRDRGRTISLRGEIVPYVRLREAFNLPGGLPAVEQVVVTRHENGRTGIAVDDVVGQQQTVIKNLGRYLGRVPGISGATINGDGSIALILDVAQLIHGVQREFEQSWGG